MTETATTPRRRLAYSPRFSSKTTEFRILKMLRQRAFEGDVSAMEAMVRLSREDRLEKGRQKKLKQKMEKARLARAAKTAAKAEAAPTE